MYDKFIAEGAKICYELIESFPQFISEIYVVDQNVNPKLSATVISSNDMSKISALSTPSEILMIVDLIPFNKQMSNKIFDRALILDRVQDPGNLGTIIRTADWFGIENVVLSTGCADVFNSKVLQATMGSFLRVNLFQNIDLFQFLKSNTIPVYAGVMDGKPLESLSKISKGFILLGNEGKGVDPVLQPFISNPIRIAGKGGAESLNVAVATGIICHHLL